MYFRFRSGFVIFSQWMNYWFGTSIPTGTQPSQKVETSPLYYLRSQHILEVSLSLSNGSLPASLAQFLFYFSNLYKATLLAVRSLARNKSIGENYKWPLSKRVSPFLRIAPASRLIRGCPVYCVPF